MITLAIRLFLVLGRSDLVAHVQHEIAHRACETLVYTIVAPGIGDDETTPLGEELSEILCRSEPSLPGDPERDPCVERATSAPGEPTCEDENLTVEFQACRERAIYYAPRRVVRTTSTRSLVTTA